MGRLLVSLDADDGPLGQDGMITWDEFKLAAEKANAVAEVASAATEVEKSSGKSLKSLGLAALAVSAMKDTTLGKARKIFDAVDTDGSGTITRAEFTAKLKADSELEELLGMKDIEGKGLKGAMQMGKLLKAIDSDDSPLGQDGMLTWEEFSDYVKATLEEDDEEEPSPSLKTAGLVSLAVAAMQPESDDEDEAADKWNGLLGALEFAKKMKSTGDSVLGRAKQAFDAVDTDGSGTVTRAEFTEKLKADDELEQLLGKEDIAGKGLKGAMQMGRLLKSIDGDDSPLGQDGKITWEEFSAAVTKASTDLDAAKLEKEAAEAEAAAKEAKAKKQALASAKEKLSRAQGKLSAILALRDADADERGYVADAAVAEEQGYKAAADKAEEKAVSAKSAMAKWQKASGAMRAVAALKGPESKAIESSLGENKIKKFKTLSLAVLATTGPAEAEATETANKAGAALGAVKFLSKLKTAAAAKEEPKSLKALFGEVAAEVATKKSVVEALQEEVAAGKKAKSAFAAAAMAARFATSLGEKDEEAEAEEAGYGAAAAEAAAKDEKLEKAHAAWLRSMGKLSAFKALKDAAKTAPPPAEGEKTISFGGAALSARFVKKLAAKAEEEEKTTSLKAAGLAVMLAKRKKAEVSLAGAATASLFASKLAAKAVASSKKPSGTRAKAGTTAYLSAHPEISEVLNKAVNAAVIDRAEDPIAYIAEELTLAAAAASY